MELFKRILTSTKTAIVLSIIIIVLLFICKDIVVYKFETLASYFYGAGADNKGKLLTVILTTIGGLGALWGLWLNNQRLNQQIRQVNEQTRQNNIAVQNSNDKRFGEAIGYLNGDNEGIVTGGVYALYQLAKEDSRYAPIVTNIFCNYVNDNTDKQDKKSYQTILSLLFSKDNHLVFNKQPQFSNINFSYTTLFCHADDVRFDKCKFKAVNLIGEKGVVVADCNIEDTVFIDFNAVRFLSGNLKRSAIISNKLSNISLEVTTLSNAEIIVSNLLLNLIIDTDTVDNVRVYAYGISHLNVSNFSSPHSKLSIHYVSQISEKNIDSIISESNAIEFIQDDEVKSDKSYRRRVG